MKADNHKAIIKAAKKGDTAALRQLVKSDATLLSARDTDGSTPLHCAAWKGHVDAVRLLLDAGADIDAKSQNDHYGDTALHAAAHGNQKDVVQLLIERGAKINAKNRVGRTPLGETTWHNATAAAKLLLAAGAR
jgi:ankyrin repeat protein